MIKGHQLTNFKRLQNFFLENKLAIQTADLSIKYVSCKTLNIIITIWNGKTFATILLVLAKKKK